MKRENYDRAKLIIDEIEELEKLPRIDLEINDITL